MRQNRRAALAVEDVQSGFGQFRVAAHEIRARVGIDDVSDLRRSVSFLMPSMTWLVAAPLPEFNNMTPSEPICTPMFPPAPAIM